MKTWIVESLNCFKSTCKLASSFEKNAAVACYWNMQRWLEALLKMTQIQNRDENACRPFDFHLRFEEDVLVLVEEMIQVFGFWFWFEEWIDYWELLLICFSWKQIFLILKKWRLEKKIKEWSMCLYRIKWFIYELKENQK